MVKDVAGSRLSGIPSPVALTITLFDFSLITLIPRDDRPRVRRRGRKLRQGGALLCGHTGSSRDGVLRNDLSDQRSQSKGELHPIDRADILSQVAGLDITSWSYRSDPSHARHLGPMAQDFRSTFGLGSSDEAIFLVDADGVALAAIQALNAELASLREESASLRETVEALQKRLTTMQHDAAPK